jgi:hypothetical protein
LWFCRKAAGAFSRRRREPLERQPCLPCLKVRELSARADDLALQLVEANEQVL